MTPTEAVMLVRFVEALCPQQAIDEYTADAWHEVLGHLELAECRAAVTAVARMKPFVSPSEIIAEVAKVITAEIPHSNACRGEDHRDCRVSWCNCYCHPVNIQGAGPSPDPHQLGPGHDDPENPWGSIGM